MGLVDVLFSFHGRINRAQYWLGNTIVSFVTGFAFIAMVMSLFRKPEGGLVQVIVLGLFVIAAFGAAGWSSLALQVKRLHDRGRTGYIVLLPFVAMTAIGATFTSYLAAGAKPMELASALQPLFIASSLINMYFFVDLGCLPSAAGDNKYSGPRPGAPQGGAAAAAKLGLVGAQDAIDRAIADKTRLAQPAMAASAPRPQPPRPSVGAAPSFGRRVPR